MRYYLCPTRPASLPSADEIDTYYLEVFVWVKVTLFVLLDRQIKCYKLNQNKHKRSSNVRTAL